MKKIIFGWLVLAFLICGCSTLTEKEKLLQKGTFEEKVAYLDKHSASKNEVVELLGKPDRTKKFYDRCAIWYYEKTEVPLEITFGRSGQVLRIDTPQDSEY